MRTANWLHHHQYEPPPPSRLKRDRRFRSRTPRRFLTRPLIVVVSLTGAAHFLPLPFSLARSEYFNRLSARER